jgi:hypothetical protein
MEVSLRAGTALYNAGNYHAAHDAWEDTWLALDTDTPDERLLHGLIQFTAAVHHARGRNWSGATGLAASALDYLAGLGDERRGVDLVTVRAYLDGLAADPELAERRRPPPLRHEGRAVGLDDLGFEAVTVAAGALAEADGHDETIVARAVEFAREEIAGGERTLFTELLFTFVESGGRGLVYRRLERHVARREREYEDVEGLF